MRPIELVLENFGPYTQRAVVDFTSLGSLFLVWGKTGSGKTTLFDAMAYALYGEAPGSRRQIPAELRSQNAAQGAIPLVLFHFALGSREWRCRRSPPFSRPAQRGGKMVEVPQAATLESWSGEIWTTEIEGVNPVNERVKGLLGLSAEEFSKIILLPQGEFQRFLEMASSDRVDILEKIFPVDLHDRVTTLAVEKSKAAIFEARRLDAEISRLASEVEGAGGGIGLGRLDGETKRLEAARDAAMEARVRAEQDLVRGREDQERRVNFERASARLALAEAEATSLPELKRRLDSGRRAAELLPRIEEAERLAEDSAMAAVELGSRRDRLAEIEVLAASRDEDLLLVQSLGAEVEGMDRQLGELSKAVEAWEAVAALKNSCEASRRDLGLCEGRLGAARETEAGLRASLAALGLSAEDEELIHSSFSSAREVFERSKTIERGVEVLVEAEEGQVAAEISVKEARVALVPADLELALAETLREEGLAAELAQSLVEGDPCPVCGSREHPCPANRTIDEAVLSQQADRLEKARGSRERLYGSLRAAEARLAASLESLEKAQSAVEGLLGTGLTLPGMEAARTARLQAQAMASEMAKKVTELGELRRRREKLGQDAEAARAERELAERLVSDAKTLHATRQAELNSRLDQAGMEDPRPQAEALARRRKELETSRAAALLRISAWERERTAARSLFAESEARQPLIEAAHHAARIRSLESLREAQFADEEAVRIAFLPRGELAELERELRRRETALLSARASAEEAARALGFGAPVEIQALEASASEAAKAVFGLQSEFDAVMADRNRLESLIANLRRVQAERADLDSSSGRLAALADLLAGNIAPRRLPFKNFVLGAYFRVVVDRASLRLAELSDGRYTLLAVEGQVGGRGRIGLEISVRDAYSGRTRPTGTLSGGERFLTSLALALGLADTIRSRSGGVSLDAVFIDEGFGSLDEDALELAISALDRARGDRMIGIVSHVAELRCRIPSRIEVKKGKNGSTIDLVSQ